MITNLPARKSVDHYSVEQLCALLEKAASMGFDLGPGCELEKITISELAALVSPVGEA